MYDNIYNTILKMTHKSYKQCLSDHGYLIIEILKYDNRPGKDNKIIAKVKKNNISYVAKILLRKKTIYAQEKDIIKTEVQALKYFTNIIKLPFFVKYIDNWNCDDNNIVIMEYISGKPLINYKNSNCTRQWWKSLIMQLIYSVSVMENHKILHNDFWDKNIIIHPISTGKILSFNNDKIKIPNAGFIIKIIDHQNTHQYKRDRQIYSSIIASRNKKYDHVKKIYGWSSKFHIGGDLNNILGILSHYKHIPNHIKKLLEQLPIKNENYQFSIDRRYVIQSTNKKTSGNTLLKNKIFFPL